MNSEIYDELEKLNDNAIGRVNQVVDQTNTGFKNLSTRIEMLESMDNRPRGGNRTESKAQNEYRGAFSAWMRKPADGHRKNHLDQATKDVNISTDAQGAYALPEQISAQIERRVTQLNPFRSLVRVDTVGTNDYKALVDMGDAGSGWVAEAGTRSETAAPTLKERAPTMGEIYAYPKATEWALDDIFFNVEQWLVDSVSEQFAAAEATAIVSGDGTAKPTGFLNTPPVQTADDASPMRSAEALEYIGLANVASPVVLNYQSLVDLVMSLKERYLLGSNVAFVMNRTTLAQVRKLVDTTGQPIWTPAMTGGTPSTLLGYPVLTCDAMPTFADDTFAIAFGNWRQGYLLAQRNEIRILANPFSQIGYVSFYVRKREGGIILNNDALKILRIAD